jgi:hypothetical protein
LAVFLIDQELLGFKETGLDLIESLRLAEQAVLVTSRYDDADVMRKCETLGVRLLPKGAAAYVPIRSATTP